MSATRGNKHGGPQAYKEPCSLICGGDLRDYARHDALIVTEEEYAEGDKYAREVAMRELSKPDSSRLDRGGRRESNGGSRTAKACL